VLADIYALIRSGESTPPVQSTVSTFRSATQVAGVISAMLASYSTGAWQKVQA
jgi:hypothetical protein